ncbi:hypothetical protein [Halogranum amylolyticum]|nr:hypothetical protein [Halogranum amylolyticum]
MPAVPHYPSDEPDSPTGAPDLEEIVDRILHGGDDRSPSPSAV